MTRPQTRAAARRVAARVLEGVEDAGQRLTAFARAGRPALNPAADAERGDLVVTQVASADPAASTPAPEAAPRIVSADASAPPTSGAPDDLAWILARHVSERLDTLRTTTLHTDLRAADGRHDPEAVRRVRISARRLRSFADLFASAPGAWIGRKRGLRIRQELRTITRVLGPLRDLDGSMLALTKAGESGPPLLRAATEHLGATVARQQDEALEAAERAFGDVDVRRLQRDLDVARRRVSERLIAAGPGLAQALHEAFGQHATALFGQTPIPPTLQDMDQVHDVRITAKRLRYALEWIKPALQHGPGPKRPLKRTQRVIGKARDLELRAATVSQQRRVLSEAGMTTLADALVPWLEQIERDRARAAGRILPALGQLEAAVVIRLGQEALGCADPSDPADSAAAPGPSA